MVLQAVRGCSVQGAAGYLSYSNAPSTRRRTARPKGNGNRGVHVLPWVSIEVHMLACAQPTQDWRVVYAGQVYSLGIQGLEIMKYIPDLPP